MAGAGQPEQVVLVLQGGGALGAYQAGAQTALAEAGLGVDWVAGISIGAINGALICGNPPGRRAARLRRFWQIVTSGLPTGPWLRGAAMRRAYTEYAAAAVMLGGVPGFFRPRLPQPGPLGLWPMQSVYDTGPLARTLGELVDFDYLNAAGPRLSIGAVDIETGNFTYFDSRSTRIGPEHVMASGALPPGLPGIEIAGRHYWDGGLVSNTPLQFVLDAAGRDPLLIFQCDLFSARGALPGSLVEVEQRRKDIQYSSRTRLTTDRYAELHRIRRAAQRLHDRLPPELRQDADLDLLCHAGPGCALTLVQLIHHKTDFETHSKDYEFSRISMQEHWRAGEDDVRRTLGHPDWQAREADHDGLQVFDLARPTRGGGPGTTRRAGRDPAAPEQGHQP